MSDINQIDLRLVDTTILLVFLGAMRHRQATAVAREMGLTQPAVSHALKRLRKLYDDPLFLRRAHGLEPTALAHELEPKVRRIVRLISQTLEGADEFDDIFWHVALLFGCFSCEWETTTFYDQTWSRGQSRQRDLLRATASPDCPYLGCYAGGAAVSPDCP